MKTGRKRAGDLADNKQRRRRARFSIRAILVLTTTVAVLLGILFGVVVPRAQRQQAAVERLDELYYSYTYSPGLEEASAPEWAVRMLGHDFFCAVTSVRAGVNNNPFGEFGFQLDLEPLRDLRDIEKLELDFHIGPGDDQTLDFDLSPVGSCSRLREINIELRPNSSGWENLDLSPLSSCNALEVIAIDAVDYHEHMFVTFGRCRSLTSIKLVHADVQGEWLSHLRSAESLENIELENTEFVVNYDAWKLGANRKLVPANDGSPLFHLHETSASTRADDFPEAELEQWLNEILPGVKVLEEFKARGLGAGGGFGGGAPAAPGAVPAGGGGIGNGPKN